MANAFIERETMVFRDEVTFENGFIIVPDQPFEFGDGAGNIASTSNSSAIFWNGCYFQDPAFNIKFAPPNATDEMNFKNGATATASGNVGSFAQGSNVTTTAHAGSFAQGNDTVTLVETAIDTTGNTVNTTTDIVTLTSHGLQTGDAVIFTTSGGGVIAGTVYYVDRINASDFSLHTTFANAKAGTPHLDLSADLFDGNILFRVGGTFAQGAASTASAHGGSFAQGDGATASGQRGSFAQGVDITANADWGSFAQGYQNLASGSYGSFAQGRSATASSATGSFAQGYIVIASGNQGSFAQGKNAVSSGSNGSFAQGGQTTASGYKGSFAQGATVIASANNGSFAQGSSMLASGSYGSFAQGRSTTASGAYGCFAQGAYVTASGSLGCFAQGRTITTTGSQGSFTQGLSVTNTAHAGSFAQGRDTQALVETAIDTTGNTVNTTTDIVTLTAHGLQTGDAVIFTTSGGGVIAGTVYYVDRINANDFSLHTTFANAKAGTPHLALSADLFDGNILFRVGGTFAQGAASTASAHGGSFAQGDGATASGQRGSFAQGVDVTANADWGSFAQGYQNLASGSYGSFAQGKDATTSGNDGCFAQGTQVTASGNKGCLAQGADTTASADHAWAQGSSVIADKKGQFARATGVRTAVADAQTSWLMARRIALDGTTVELTTDGQTPGANTRITVASGKAMAFHIIVMARQYGGSSGTIGDCNSFEITGAIKNTAGTTAIVGSSTAASIGTDAAASAWTAVATADDAEDALTIDVTGEADKSIHWVATLIVSESA